MPMIPYTGQYAQTDTEQVFSQAFAEQAYSLLGSRFPNLLESVATFKVVEADLASGKAVGTFILVLGPEVLYIPVVLGEGEVRPLMVLYHKRTDMFTPLNSAWIERVLADSQRSIGEPALQPATLSQDVSLRSLVRPPNLIGRFAYAADATSYGLAAVDQAPNEVKEAFAKVLTSDTDLLEHMVNVYDLDQIKDALRKEASKVAKEDLPDEVVVFTDDPKRVEATQFKEMFGDRAPEAYESLVTRGVAIADSRLKDSLNSLARLDIGGNYEEIKDPGVYEVVFADGEAKICFAFRDRGDVRPSDPPVGRYITPGERGGSSHQHPRVMIVMPDGDLVSVDNALGRPMKPEALKGAAIYDVLFGGKQVKPGPGQKGFFVFRKDNGSWTITPRIEVDKVVSEGEVNHYIGSISGMGKAHFVADPSVPVRTPRYLSRRTLTYLPPSAGWLRIGNVRHSESGVIDAPDALAMLLHSRIRARGARDLKIQSLGADAFSLDGRPTVTKADAVKRLMTEYHLGEDDAFDAVKSAATNEIFRSLILPPKFNTKASAFSSPEEEQYAYEQQMMQQGDPAQMQQMQQMQGDPSQMQGDPSQMQGDPSQMQGDPAMMGQMQQPEVPVSYGDDVTIDPALMQQVAQAQMMDPAVLDAAVIVSLSRVPELRELILGYLPNLKQALDNFGRILLAVWIHQDSVREQVGDSAFSSLEDTLITTFKTVGDTILRLSDGTDIFEDTKD